MANSLASTITGLAYGLTKIDSTTVSTPGLQTSQVLSKLSESNAEWARTFIRGGGEAPSLLERECGFEIAADQSLGNDIETTTTDINIFSSTDFDTSGAAVIWDDEEADIFEYTDNVGNQLLGSTGIDWNHEEDDTVSKLYKLPTNFGSLRTQDDAYEGVIVNGEEYVFTSGTPRGGDFTIYDNGTNKFLFLPRGLSGFVLVRYNKSSTVIDDLTDTVDVPVEYEWFLVYRISAHMERVRGNYDIGTLYDQKADEILLEAQKEKNVRRVARVRGFRNLHRVNLARSHQLYD